MRIKDPGAIQTARANIFFIFFMSLASLMDYEFHAQAELRVECPVVVPHRIRSRPVSERIILSVRYASTSSVTAPP